MKALAQFRTLPHSFSEKLSVVDILTITFDKIRNLEKIAIGHPVLPVLFIYLIPDPCPDAVSVFIPLFLSISTSSQRNAEISCLISFTSSSVTPWDSALRCSTVTYRRTKFRIIVW